MEDFKRVVTDGLPFEDGNYLLIIKGEHPAPLLSVRYTHEDGKVIWVRFDSKQIIEDQITMYKKILITPEAKK